MIEITTALTSARSLLDLAKAALDARDDIKLKAAMVELLARLQEAQVAAIASVEKARALQQQLEACDADKADIRAQLKERRNYALYEVVPGAFLYRFEQGDGPGEPAHYLCQVCWDGGVKSVLQVSPDKSILGCKVDATHSLRIGAGSPLVTSGRRRSSITDGY